MERSFSTNSYYLLGLSTSASQNDIKKQSRLITAQLFNGESNLDSDFNYLKADRTENTISNAVQYLSSPLKKVKDVYFWFSDENYAELTKEMSNQPLEEIYVYLSNRANKDGKWNDKRNLAIFLTQLLQYKKIYKKYLKESLELWKSLIDSGNSWKYFELYYKNIDDLEANESVFSGLRAYVNQEIPDIYSELSQKWNDKEYVQSYSRLFNRMGSITEKKIYEPCAIKIDGASKKLSSIKWDKDEPSKENLRDVKEAIHDIQESLNLLIENGIFEGSQAVILRDKAAESIRGVGIKLYNDYLDYEKANGIINIADKIAGTAGLKGQLGEDKSTTEKNIATEKVTLPILELVKEQQWVKALELIDKLIRKHSHNNEIINILKQHRREIVMRSALEQHADAMTYLNSGSFMDCKTKLIELQKYLLKELDIFNIRKEWTDSIEMTIRESTGRIDSAQVAVLDNYRLSKVGELKNEFGESFETSISIMLFDTYFYVSMCDYFQKVRSHNQTVSTLITIGYWTILFYGLGLVPLLIGYYIKRQEVVYVR